MISAFEVYLVMQLDTISTACIIAFVVTGVVSVAAILDGIDNSKDWLVRGGVGGLVFSALFGLAATFLPSSKTAAAMIIVPALTSEEVVEPVAAEAKELYQLAKEALREVAKPDKESEE